MNRHLRKICTAALQHQLDIRRHGLPKTIREILHQQGESTESIIKAHGWVKGVRKQRTVTFIRLNDGSLLNDLQVVIPTDAVNDASITPGTSLQVLGRITPSPGALQAFEMQAEQIRVLGESPGKTYPIQKKEQSLEHLRSHAHLRTRTTHFAAMTRIRSAAMAAFRDYLTKKCHFLEITAPSMTFTDCEGAGETFAVEKSADFFGGKPAYLTVSAQLHAEMAAAAVPRVFTFGPVFRAERHNTIRHLAEFWMLEAEMAFVTDLGCLMDFAETCLREAFCAIHEDSAGEDLEYFAKADPSIKDRWKILQENRPFIRIPYAHAVELLSKASAGFQTDPSVSLQLEHERYLTEIIFQGRPVFVTDYPANQKPFYMRRNPENPNTVANFDLLLPHLQETIGGSLREDRPEVLAEAIEAYGLSQADYEWYLDLRRYGSVPHGGFGIGFDRFIQFITGTTNIRDVVLVPRSYHSRQY